MHEFAHIAHGRWVLATDETHHNSAAVQRFRIIKELSTEQLQNSFTIHNMRHDGCGDEIELTQAAYELPKTEVLAIAGIFMEQLARETTHSIDSVGRFERKIDQFYNNGQIGSHTAALQNSNFIQGRSQHFCIEGFLRY